MKLRRERWLALLDGLARTELPDPPDSLESKLRAHLDAQWIVIDCLGLPLANTLQKVVSGCLSQWRPESMEFALVSPNTSTEAFYLKLTSPSRVLVVGDPSGTVRIVNDD